MVLCTAVNFTEEAGATPKLRNLPEFTDAQARQYINAQQGDNVIRARLTLLAEKYEIACENTENLTVQKRDYSTELIALKIECGAIGVDDLSDSDTLGVDMFDVWNLLIRPSEIKQRFSRQNIDILSKVDLSALSDDERLKVKKVVRAYQDKGKPDDAERAIGLSNGPEEVQKLLSEIKHDRLNGPTY